LLSRTLLYLKDCRVQTKQKRTQKQSYKRTHFYRKWKPLSFLFTFGNTSCVNDSRPILTY